jgi:hypothetical protein
VLVAATESSETSGSNMEEFAGSCQLTLKHGACILIWKCDVDEFDIQRPCLRSATNRIQYQFNMELPMKVKPY